MLCKWGENDVLRPDCIGVRVPADAAIEGTWVDGSMGPPFILTTAMSVPNSQDQRFHLERGSLWEYLR